MKRAAYILGLIFILINTSNANCQNIEYNINLGGNMNFVMQRSSYNISDNINIKPYPSFNLGGSLKRIDNNLNIIGAIDYVRISNYVENLFAVTDENALQVGITDGKVINHEIIISAIGEFKIYERLYAGAGLSLNTLLYSLSKSNIEIFLMYNGTSLGQTFNNNYHKRFKLSVPIQIGYDFGRFNIYSRFYIGLANRLNGESNVKEIDNLLMICTEYKFN